MYIFGYLQIQYDFMSIIVLY